MGAYKGQVTFYRGTPWSYAFHSSGLKIRSGRWHGLLFERQEFRVNHPHASELILRARTVLWTNHYLLTRTEFSLGIIMFFDLFLTWIDPNSCKASVRKSGVYGNCGRRLKMTWVESLNKSGKVENYLWLQCCWELEWSHGLGHGDLS